MLVVQYCNIEIAIPRGTPSVHVWQYHGTRVLEYVHVYVPWYLVYLYHFGTRVLRTYVLVFQVVFQLFLR
jgi:hypothetical protein